MSEIKVNKISPRTNCGTTQLGDSGDTFTIPAGATAKATGASASIGSVVYESGDTVILGATSLGVTAAEWAGNAGQIYVASGISGLATQAAGIMSATGSVSVFDAGDDLVVGLKVTTAAGSNSGMVFFNIVGGGSLVKVNTYGMTNKGTANFGFTIAADTGTAGSANSTGVAITFA